MSSLTAAVPSLGASPKDGSLHVAIQETNQTDGNEGIAKSTPEADAQLRTVDDLVRHRAQLFPHRKIVSYPSSGIEYVDYTMQQLDVFAYRVAVHFQAQLPVRKSSTEKPMVVAMLGPSNLEYLITMLALMKLGHTILFVSTRISPEAIASLVEKTQVQAILADSRYFESSHKVQKLLPETKLGLLEIAPRTVFEFPVEAHTNTRLDVDLDPEVETNNVVYIIHSSGSTGFPKPIYQFQRAALANYAISMDMEAFITLPLYHNHGICNFFRAVHSGKSIAMYNADLPLTSEYLTAIFRANRFEIFYGVPYALKLLAETDAGVELLRQLRVVMYGGSACPDELGDLLVSRGVNLVSHYGATEVGQLMTSFRPAGDTAWNYVRETPRLAPFLSWIPRGPNLFECAVLEGWPSKLQSNQPDGSYATKDLFEPHPTISGAWKYIARLDDTIVLVNGEKFNPVQTEGRIRSEPSVAEAVVFGAGRPYLGLLVVPAQSTKNLSSQEIFEQIWPVIDSANQTNDSFARISKNMVKVLPHDANCPRTDKGSIIRQAFYKAFSNEIEQAYDLADTSSSDRRVMDMDELKAFLRTALLEVLDKKDLAFEDDTDFFTLGMDSLQAIQLRSEILQNVDVGDSKIGQNVAFDCPSIAKLAAHLLELRTGEPAGAKVSVVEQMQALVDKYTVFPPRTAPARSSVVVTGVTGSLGAHVVARLANDASVRAIYCLVRAKDDESALTRVRDSLVQRRIYHNMPLAARNKLRALRFDQSDAQLGLDEAQYGDIARDLRSVIHCAWSVNFNLHLSSFERDCIAGMQNLMALCHASGSFFSVPASFNFCSSVSSTASAPTGVVIPEEVVDYTWAQGMGYAQSKSVAEHMCIRAAEVAGVPARVLRVGQIVGDTVHGIWNATEAIPIMMQAAITIGALPRLPETPAWLPVDTAAQAVLDISLSLEEKAGLGFVTNVVNKATFRWTEDLLPALRAAGLSFEEVSPKEWIRRLRESNPDPKANPPIKLVDFFASKYDKDLSEFTPSKQYTTARACSLSPALAEAPVLDQNAVNKYIQYFLANVWERPQQQQPEEAKQEQPQQPQTKIANGATTPPSSTSSSPAPTSRKALPAQAQADAAGGKTKAKTVLIFSGPCGSGKTTAGRAAAQWRGGAFVEGDSLHTQAAVARMAGKLALDDAARWGWLDRVAAHAREAALDLGYDVVAVSCSALRRAYRDRLRERLSGGDDGVRVVFVDLQAGRDVLVERVRRREGHYMTDEMVDGQVESHEDPAVDEVDVIPVSVEAAPEEVEREVRWAVGQALDL